MGYVGRSLDGSVENTVICNVFLSFPGRHLVQGPSSLYGFLEQNSARKKRVTWSNAVVAEDGMWENP